MSCDLDWIAALATGALDPDDDRAARAHVLACAACARELDQVVALEGRLRGLRSVARPALLGELAHYLATEKKWWLAPLLAVLVLFSMLIVFAEGSAFAPLVSRSSSPSSQEGESSWRTLRSFASSSISCARRRSGGSPRSWRCSPSSRSRSSRPRGRVRAVHLLDLLSRAGARRIDRRALGAFNQPSRP